MNLALHIVRKDFLRLRWPLAARLLVIALKLAVGFSIVLSGGFAALETKHLEDLTYGLLGLELLVTFVLTAMLVQEDALVGTTQFWTTRPISGARLLRAKILGWLLLLGLPSVVVTLPWWLTCAFGPREIALASLEMLGMYALVSLPAALVAVITDSLSRFLVWALVFLFGLAVVPSLIAYGISRSMNNSALPAFAVGGWAAFALVMVAVIARQFCRRDLMRSLTWLAAGAVASFFVALATPTILFSFDFKKTRSPDWHPERASSVKLSFHSFRSNAGTRVGDESVLQTYFSVRGLPAGTVLDGTLNGGQTLRWPDGLVVSRRAYAALGWDDERGLRSALGTGEWQKDEETERYRTRRRIEKNPKLSAGPPQPDLANGAEIEIGVLPSTIARVRKSPPAMEAALQLRLLRPEVWLEVPLSATGWHARAANGFYLGPISYPMRQRRPDDDDWADFSNSPELPLVTTRAYFVWDGWLDGAHFRFPQGTIAGLYSLHRGDADLQGPKGGNYTTLFIGSVGISRDTMNVWQPANRRGDKWVPRNPHWLEGLTVALVGFRDESRFTVEVKADRYENPK